MDGKSLSKSKSEPDLAQLSVSKFKPLRNQQVNSQSPKSKLSENLSFCGCGFLGIYHVGVASCFHKYAPQLSMHKISGSSAGALVAAAHICGNLQLAYATTDILKVAIDARGQSLGPFHPSFDINAIVRDTLERGLPEDVHLRASGKLHISLTRYEDFENVVVSKFDSKEDVIQALLCSCFIPVFSGLVAPKYKGVTYIDGGFSNNLLILDEKTVTVSPFAGEADICPQDDVYNLLSISLSNTSFSITPHNLYRLSHALLPPPPEVLSSLCEQGFADGIRFLHRMRLINCVRCIEIRSSTYETSESFIEETYTCHEQTQKESIATTTSTTKTSSTMTTATTTNEFEHSAAIFDTSSLYGAGEIYEDEYCYWCDLRSSNALQDPLPKQYTDRIREACDTVNKSLYNWFYSHRPIKYLSYLAAPYYLPMNLSLALISKYWQQIPMIGIELIKCMHDLKDLLLDIMRKFNENSMLTASSLLWDEKKGDEITKQTHKSASESSISVKITADCRRSSQRSLTTYECCLTIALFGRGMTTIIGGTSN